MVFAISNLKSQVEYLRLSPTQTLEQRVGMTDIKLKYARPQLKGRKIFGHLVPFNEMWRTGANENTTISFSHRVRIGDVEVEAGKYAIFTKPAVDKWEIFIYTDTNNLDVPNPIDSSKLIYLSSVASMRMENKAETLTINFYDLTEDSAKLGIAWEFTRVLVPISFYTREAMEKQIEKEFRQNIFDYSIAASYYQDRDIELVKAKKLRELVMALKEESNAWDHHSYGVVLMKLGMKEEALQHLSRSMEKARESNNTYLIEENSKLLEKLK